MQQVKEKLVVKVKHMMYFLLGAFHEGDDVLLMRGHFHVLKSERNIMHRPPALFALLALLHYLHYLHHLHYWDYLHYYFSVTIGITESQKNN